MRGVHARASVKQLSRETQETKGGGVGPKKEAISCFQNNTIGHFRLSRVPLDGPRKKSETARSLVSLQM